MSSTCFCRCLDEGHLPTRKDATSISKTLFMIMTSNIGSQHILDYQLRAAVEGDKVYPEMKEQVMQALREHFRPGVLQ